MATLNNPYLTSLQLSGWDTGMYPQAKIYWTGAREIDQSPINLNDIGGGLYSSMDFVPSTAGYYSIQYTVYTDAGHTTSSNNYGRAADILYVEDTETTTEWISSQITDIHNDVNYISSVAFPSGDIIRRGDAAWTTGAGGGSGGGGSQYISSQLDYISSQIGFISGGLEAYGGGGGKSYNVYTRGKSPWTHAQRDHVVSGVRVALEKVDKLAREARGYHDDEMQEIDSKADTILVRIDRLSETLSTIKNNIKKIPVTKESKKIIKEINLAMESLDEYRGEVSGSSSEKELQSINRNVEMLMAKILSDEELEEYYERYTSERVQKKNRKNKD